MAILDHALAWAARGFRVFPLLQGDKVPPKDMRWKVEATTDPAKIRAWWAFDPSYNYAVAAGNGTLILDIDAGKNGYASLLDIDLPPTLTVKTPGGGEHQYFTGPDVANSVDRIAPGLDIRSAGGYVVGPGSYFADPGGKKGYTGHWQVVQDMAPAPAPESFVLLCGQPKARDHGPAVSIDDPDDIVFAIHYLLKDAPIAIEGRGGNGTTYAVAARVIEIGVSSELACDLMAEHWNERCLPPWSREELLTLCRNAENYAQNRQGSGSVSNMAAEGGDPGDVLTADQPTPEQSVVGKYDKVFARRRMRDEADIPARDWVMHRMLIRRKAALIAGPGGAGKSGFSLALAAHGAVGRDFAGFPVKRPFKTLVYNFEDDLDEMEARMHATCATYGLDIREIEQSVLLWPGEEMKFKLMNRDHTYAMADMKELARLVRGNAFDAIVLDPLVSLHSEDENDNMAMQTVMEALNGLARMANAAVLALHHTPKGVRQAGSAEAFRGAGNILNAVRVAATLYPADEADASLYGFGEGYKSKYVRIDDAKQSMAAQSTKPIWLEKQGFPLQNGDSTYSLKPFETSATAAGEAKLIAEVIGQHMLASSTAHLGTYEAAKVLVSLDNYFRDRVPKSGDCRNVKTLIELRLAQGVVIDSGETVRAVMKTEPGSATAKGYVEIG